MANYRLPFGFIIRREEKENVSFTPKVTDDGALERVSSGAGFFGYNHSFDFLARNEVELINKYRQIQYNPELDSAIEDITCEAITVADIDEYDVSLNIKDDEKQIPEEVKQAMVEEFRTIMALLNYRDEAHDLFRNWYVDGRIYFHIVVDEENLDAGIQELRQIDPRKIKKVREIVKRNTPGGVSIIEEIQEYYVYNDAGINEAQGVKLSPDTIVFVPSGRLDENNQVISYLHKAIKPANMLRMMEDAMLIYQLVRSPQRRAFYIDVGGMPKTKQEQYLQEVMTKYRNKVVYNSNTGELRDDRQHLSMIEDYWLPRTSQGRATEITTIDGAQLTGQIEALMAYKDKLAKALNVPLSRMAGDTPFNMGRSMEITRDEIKFSKFISRLRKKFSEIFDQALRVQLILKGIIAPEDWTFIRTKLEYQFPSDNNFEELRENEVLMQRIQMFEAVEPLIGRYYSEEWARRKILRQTDEAIETETARIEIENELRAEEEMEEAQEKIKRDAQLSKEKEKSKK